MSQYNHLTIIERECILKWNMVGKSIRWIAKKISRSASTISRELKRNKMNEEYSAVKAQSQYEIRRKKCKPRRLLESKLLKQLIQHFIVEEQWSPEQISARLKLENATVCISYSTIYREIYAGNLELRKLSGGERGIARKLRHRGKTRHTKNHQETRGKIKVSNSIHDRPLEANNRSTIGHWEADTMAGKTGSSCLVTLTDRHSRFLLSGKVDKKLSQLVSNKIIELLSVFPKESIRSITPDRGKEFSKHPQVTDSLNNVPFYFSDPHSPWQRGTNENTNGLLREYLPKGQEMNSYTASEIQQFTNKLNKRPRKCLNWRTPFEVFFNSVLHLI